MYAGFSSSLTFPPEKHILQPQMLFFPLTFEKRFNSTSKNFLKLRPPSCRAMYFLIQVPRLNQNRLQLLQTGADRLYNTTETALKKNSNCCIQKYAVNSAPSL